MIELTQKRAADGPVDASLTLPLADRVKSRLRVRLDNGQDAGLLLPRGTTLADGDLLCSDDGYRVRVKAAPEPLSLVVCGDPHLLARACYHLGNRHVSVQIEPGSVRYLHDHVLDEMLTGLGLVVQMVEAPFQPEAGAYGGSAESGRRSDGHGHAHQH